MSARRARSTGRIDAELRRQVLRPPRAGDAAQTGPTGPTDWSASAVPGRPSGTALSTLLVALRTTWGSRLGGPVTFVVTIAAALVAALPVVYVAGSTAASAYGALLDGSLGSRNAVAETLVQTTPLLLAGLAVATAFHAGMFNIGVEGQLAMGGLAAAVVGVKVDVPGPAHVVLAVVAGTAGGALWALIPALLKALRGVHEVVTTIMMNYLAFALSRYLVSPNGPLVSARQPSATDRVAADARLPVIWAHTRLDAGFLIAIAVTALGVWFLYRTPAGFRLRLVGANPTAARFHGVRVDRVMVAAMLGSGGLAGLAGTAQVLGLYGRYFDSFSPGYGYDAIAVALLGGLTPIGTLAAALFFGVLRAGSVQLQAVAGVSREMISVISGLVVGFVAVQPAVLRLIQRRRRPRPSAVVAEPAWPPDRPGPGGQPGAGGAHGPGGPGGPDGPAAGGAVGLAGRPGVIAGAAPDAVDLDSALEGRRA